MFTENFIQALREDKPEIIFSWTRAGTYLLETTVRGVKLTIDKDAPSWFFNYTVWIDDVLTTDIAKHDCRTISETMNEIYNQQCLEKQANLISKANEKLLKKA